MEVLKGKQILDYDREFDKFQYKFTNEYKDIYYLKRLVTLGNKNVFGWVKDGKILGECYPTYQSAILEILNCGTDVVVSVPSLKFMKSYRALWLQDMEVTNIVFLDNHTAGNDNQIFVALESNGEIFNNYKNWEEVYKDFEFSEI